MKKFCIPKEFMSDLRKSITALAPSGQMEILVKMPSDKRIEFFSKTVTQKEAELLNKEFEKAIASSKLNALKNWTRDNLDEKYRKDETIFLSKNFKNLEEVDAFIENRLNLLAEQKHKIALTDEEVAKFTELGKKFYEETKKIGNDLGSMDNKEESFKWGESYEAISKYRDSLLPVSLYRSIVNNLGKANMLASLKTPFLNIESNSINAILSAAIRRAENLQLISSVDSDTVKEYRKFIVDMYKKTGVDFSRMITIDDSVTGIGKAVGEKTDTIKNKALNAYSDFIFNKTLTTPDVFFSSIAFTDSLSLHASRVAKGDKELATKLFKEATKINATGEAKAIRELAIADARMSTYTNDTMSSKISEALRSALNIVPGVGDFVMPFVKTPANLAELGTDYAGLGLVKGGFGIGHDFIKNKKVDRAAMRGYMTNIARSGLGMSVAFLLASAFNPEDFMGTYDPDRIKIDQLSNATYNAIRVKTPFGERWISVDYLGPLSNAFVSWMYAKKYGSAGKYLLGSTSAYLSQLPFVDAKSLFDGVDLLTDPEKKKDIKKFGDTLWKNAGDTVSARLVPGLMLDIAKAFDDVQRDTSQKKYIIDTPIGSVNFDKFVNKIPFLRGELPKKHDALGRLMFESSPIESLLFGSRVKTARTDSITKEIYRLRDEGNTPNIKDLRFMYSDKVDELKKKVGDKAFYRIAREYGRQLANSYSVAMSSSDYLGSSNEKKQKILEDIGQKLYVKTLKDNGITYGK